MRYSEASNVTSAVHATSISLINFMKKGYSSWSHGVHCVCELRQKNFKNYFICNFLSCEISSRIRAAFSNSKLLAAFFISFSFCFK